jgi:GDPmannose 4,6-dehydratase
MNKKTAVITGITGQDASYLSELLLEKDYIVYGMKRRSSTNTMWRIQHLLNEPNFHIIEGDITDPSSVNHVFGKIKPDEAYLLAAMSHVGTSFEQPTYTFNVNANGILYILEAIRNLSPNTKSYTAATSELMGGNYNIDKNGNKYQDENTPFSPNSPYAVAKLCAYHLTSLYRRSYNIFSCNGILFNHTSPRRGEEFVTRKITQWIGKFKKWRRQSDNLCFVNNNHEYILSTIENDYFPKLRLGNINTYRDWGHCLDYVTAQWMILQQDKPDDFVISAGKAYTVAQFCELAFSHIGISNWQDYIYIDPTLYRPCEVEYLCGRADKAKRVLGWEPKISFEELVKEMVEADIQREYK